MYRTKVFIVVVGIRKEKTLSLYTKKSPKYVMHNVIAPNALDLGIAGNSKIKEEKLH